MMSGLLMRDNCHRCAELIRSSSSTLTSLFGASQIGPAAAAALAEVFALSWSSP